MNVEKTKLDIAESVAAGAGWRGGGAPLLWGLDFLGHTTSQCLDRSKPSMQHLFLLPLPLEALWSDDEVGVHLIALFEIV